MNKNKVINDLKKYFNIRELVSPNVYYELKDRAWDLFHIDALKMLLNVRIFYQKPIIINSVKRGYKASGYRAMDCRIGAKYSAHRLGLAFDLKDARMTLKHNLELYEFILKGGKYLGVIELESKNYTIQNKVTGWVHISCRGEGFKVINP